MKNLRAKLSLLLALALTGCVTTAPAIPPSEVPRLIERPDFKAAKAAASEWAKDALKTINRLENERNQLLAK